jgi:RNA recognition motif-containing protein
MGSKIYVGGLPYSATEQELSDLFGRHGAVASARNVFGLGSAGGHYRPQRSGHGRSDLNRQ